jgi:hypothetical protein
MISAEVSGNQRPPRFEPDWNVRLAKLFADFVQYQGGAWRKSGDTMIAKDGASMP